MSESYVRKNKIREKNDPALFPFSIFPSLGDNSNAPLSTIKLLSSVIFPANYHWGKEKVATAMGRRGGKRENCLVLSGSRPSIGNFGMRFSEKGDSVPRESETSEKVNFRTIRRELSLCEPDNRCIFGQWAIGRRSPFFCPTWPPRSTQESEIYKPFFPLMDDARKFTLGLSYFRTKILALPNCHEVESCGNSSSQQAGSPLPGFTSQKAKAGLVSGGGGGGRGGPECGRGGRKPEPIAVMEEEPLPPYSLPETPECRPFDEPPKLIVTTVKKEKRKKPLKKRIKKSMLKFANCIL